MEIKKAPAAMAMAVGTALSGAALGAPPAQAATIGYVYISFPKWLANCPNGGAVKTIWADDGWQVWNADAGDDLIYGRVALGQTNTISYTLFCAKWTAGVLPARVPNQVCADAQQPDCLGWPGGMDAKLTRVAAAEACEPPADRGVRCFGCGGLSPSGSVRRRSRCPEGVSTQGGPRGEVPESGSPSGPSKTDEHAEEEVRMPVALLDARRGDLLRYLGDARNNVGNFVGAEI
jgi:hypothetical protein